MICQYLNFFELPDENSLQIANLINPYTQRQLAAPLGLSKLRIEFTKLEISFFGPRTQTPTTKKNLSKYKELTFEGAHTFEQHYSHDIVLAQLQSKHSFTISSR